MSLLSLEQAQQRLLALAPQMGEEQVALDDALGRVLTRDLESRVKRPAADLSAMDGYALAGDGPWCCVGESRAGAPFDQRIDAGETVRISTGARLPDGADRILIKEHAHIDGDAVAATEMPTAGQYIRRQGSDFEQGAAVLDAARRSDRLKSHSQWPQDTPPSQSPNGHGSGFWTAGMNWSAIPRTAGTTKFPRAMGR